MASLFGTNGVRGTVNKDMTVQLALQMGKAIGTFMHGAVAIATDTRVSADMISNAVTAGIMAVGCDVVDLGMMPTPSLQYFVKTHPGIKGGVMITASHNPPEYNGIKCIASDGTEASHADEDAIEDLYFQVIPDKPWNEIGKLEEVYGAGDVYIDAVLSQVDVDAIRDAHLTVCLDCANGAAFETSPLMMKKLGVTFTTLNANPQGEFPGHLSEPTEDNLKNLMSITKAMKADLGIAHDGDADRCVFVTSQGKYVSGDKSLALMSRYEIGGKKDAIIVTPVSSSSMVEDVVKEAGGNLMYTAVGSPVVARKMMEVGGIFGGEENGGLIFAKHQYCRDGALSAAKMLESIAVMGPLHTQLESLPVYYQDKRKLSCPNNRKQPLADHFKTHYKANRVDTTDGLKVLFDDGWVLVRASGTEAIFRIYSESKDKAIAKERADEFEKMAYEFLAPEGIVPEVIKAPAKKRRITLRKAAVVSEVPKATTGATAVPNASDEDPTDVEKPDAPVKKTRKASAKKSEKATEASDKN
jgi:phosphomannomutase / phosphoglucomutase